MRALVDANVLLDVITRDPVWQSWSEAALREVSERATLAINPIIFAEVSLKFTRIEDADAALADFAREPLPYEAGFLASKAFLAHEKRGGAKRSPMPDCYVGAYAVVGRTDSVNKATTVGGKDAWLVETHLTFDIPGLKTKGETAIVLIVATATDTSSLYYASIPDTVPQYMQTALDTMAALTVGN